MGGGGGIYSMGFDCAHILNTAKIVSRIVSTIYGISMIAVHNERKERECGKKKKRKEK